MVPDICQTPAKQGAARPKNSENVNVTIRQVGVAICPPGSAGKLSRGELAAAGLPVQRPLIRSKIETFTMFDGAPQLEHPARRDHALRHSCVVGLFMMVKVFMIMKIILIFTTGLSTLR